MKVLVTGASGFLGREVVTRAVAHGYHVVALVRPTADVGPLGWPEDVEILRGDLRQTGPWCAALSEVDAVVHLAAAASGDLATQFSSTVVSTENLLDQLPVSSLRRFVHVSSFSVYDYTAVAAGDAVTEATPIEPNPSARDAYTVTKIIQEELVRAHFLSSGAPLVVLRPGAIYGPGKAWEFGRALSVGSRDVIFSPRAQLRLTYVTNCADAVVEAIEAPVASGSTFNVVDDEVVTHASYHRLCTTAGALTGRAVHIPWFVVSAIGRVVDLINLAAFGRKALLPELLSHRRQQARWKPLSYPNDCIKSALGWSPSISLHEGVQRTVRGSSPTPASAIPPPRTSPPGDIPPAAR